MQLESERRSEQDEYADLVFAAMETGNTGRARTILEEFQDSHPEQAANLRSDVIAEYGVAL